VLRVDEADLRPRASRIRVQAGTGYAVRQARSSSSYACDAGSGTFEARPGAVTTSNGDGANVDELLDLDALYAMHAIGAERVPCGAASSFRY
jgi:hypothetical protein